MRLSALCLLVAIGLLSGMAGRADAEKVKTNQSTKLYAGPGEQKKVLVTVKSGQNMTLLAQEGRWLKVRVQGRTGFVPRSKVDMADDGDIARNTRRRPFVDGRGKKRGFGGEAGPDDRIGADAIGEGMEDEGGGEEEEEEEDEPKKPVKAAAKAKPKDDEDEPKKAKKPADDEEEDDEEPTKASADDEEEVDDDNSGEAEEEEDKRPTARVAKKVSVFAEADSESEEQFIAKPTDVLYPVESKGKWTAVENEEGDFGWVETQFLEMEDEGGGDGGGPRKRQIDLGARFGTMIIQQAMRTAGSTNLKVPDNYNIGTSSLTLSLGASYMMPFKAKYLLGAEAAYDFSKTLFGGITYDPPDVMGEPATPPVTVGVTVHNVNVRGMGGYDFRNKRGMAVLGRVGYRYQSFLIPNYSDPVKNPARIPQEIIKGPTLGVAFLMPRLTGKIGLKVALDAMVIGANLSQTTGLEDGASPSLKAVTFGTGVIYKFKKSFDLAFNYDLRYMGIDFGPPLATSMRGHMGNNVTRTDIFHMVTLGVAKPF